MPTRSDIQGHGYRIAVGEWPLVVVHFPVHFERKIMPGYRWLFEQYRVLAKGAAPAEIQWLIDFRVANPLAIGARTRREGAEVFAAHVDILREVTSCEARVIQSPFSRGVLTAFDWLTGDKWPCANFRTETEARSWIAGQSQTAHAKR